MLDSGPETLDALTENMHQPHNLIQTLHNRVRFINNRGSIRRLLTGMFKENKPAAVGKKELFLQEGNTICHLTDKNKATAQIKIYYPMNNVTLDFRFGDDPSEGEFYTVTARKNTDGDFKNITRYARKIGKTVENILV